jgi:hypothetical protein
VITPPTKLIRRRDTHRLIPSKYNPDRSSVLTKLADNDRHLEDLFALDGATNERLRAENNLLPGIGAHELVFGIPNYRVINAAFVHAYPLGSRFNSPDRGAWYAGFTTVTSQAEIIFHKATEYSEINYFEDSITYDDYLADFSAEFHDLRNSSEYPSVLNPKSYVKSQQLGKRLLEAGSLGIVYPSVRHAGGTCVVCFRPALVMNLHRGKTYRFTWHGSLTPTIQSK